MKTISGPGFTLSAPNNWNDITDEVEVDDPPFTLAAVKGIGALQFSVALYLSGEVPNPSLQLLLQMNADFGKSHHLGRKRNIVKENKPLLLAAATFSSSNDMIRAWQIFQAGNFAFVTYNCERRFFRITELEECESIVRSIKFAVSPKE